MPNLDLIERKIKSGDVILTCYRGMNWGSLPIKIANFFKRGYRERGWTHAALYVGNNTVVEAFPGGIVRRNFKDSYLNGTYNLLILRHKKANEEDLKQAVAFCVSEESKKYDFRALIYFLLYNFLPQGLHFLLEKDFIGDCFNVNDSYFCSELVSTGFKKADIYCFEKEPYKIMPIDFYNYLWFDIIERIEALENKKSFWYLIKSSIFRTLYLLAAVTFPFILVIVAILVLLLVMLAIKGIIALMILLFGLLTRASKKKNPSVKNKEDKSINRR